MLSTELAVSVLEENILIALQQHPVGIQAGKIGEIIGLPDLHDHTGTWPKGDASRSFTAMLLGKMFRCGLITVHKNGNQTIYKAK